MEKILVKIFSTAQDACQAVARRIRDLILQNQKQHKHSVLGLATGSTMIGIYQNLVEMHHHKSLILSSVVSFNLDEYWPMEPASLQSYHAWMNEVFFDHVDILPDNIHIPSGVIREEYLTSWCLAYEQAITECGGIDFQLLGIGRSGHIGFNEPGSERQSRTRRVTLDRVTRQDAAADFFSEEYVPHMAVTMGVGTILEAKEIALLAFGEHKADIIRQTVEGDVTPEIAASFLQDHPNVTIYLDEAAAEGLTRVHSPWLGGSCQWDALMERKAVTWLVQQVHQPILKLTPEHYTENHLGDAIRSDRGAYDLNLRTFRALMQTITGWPAGKDTQKRILILSPHPDDDVICMAGTLMRLIEQQHEVHVAYMVSGYLSVFDHNVRRHAQFVRQFNDIFDLNPSHSIEIQARIDQLLSQKLSGQPDPDEIKAIKSLIRRTEAIAAASFCGLQPEHIHFLDLPFYNADRVDQRLLGSNDIQQVVHLLQEIHPEIIFAAGDLSDPHGTHQVCLQAFIEALGHVAPNETVPQVWLYRGAWQEWAIEQIDMVIPLSPDELRKKRYAIFRHESQKDRAMFPGPYDEREFWQRAEQRNMHTADLYDTLGLPEYYALEAFARWPLGRSLHQQGILEATIQEKNLHE